MASIPRMELKGQKIATGVVVLEWVATLGQAIGLICLLKYLGEYSVVAADISLDPSTVLIWSSLGSVAYMILCIFLSALLTRGVSQKLMSHLSIWIILQYILFVVSFIIVIANIVGYLGFGWLWWYFITSLAYRFFILKVISEFNQQISLEHDKERRKSLPQLPPPETTAKLTQNNLHYHQQQQHGPLYIQLPQIPPQQQQPPYIRDRDFNQQEQLSANSLSSQPYHPQPPPFPPRLGRSYSESTV